MTETPKPKPQLIATYTLEMRSVIPHFDGSYAWASIGGPYEKDEADTKLTWVRTKHPDRTYRLTRTEESKNVD